MGLILEIAAAVITAGMTILKIVESNKDKK